MFVVFLIFKQAACSLPVSSDACLFCKSNLNSTAAMTEYLDDALAIAFSGDDALDLVCGDTNVEIDEAAFEGMFDIMEPVGSAIPSIPQMIDEQLLFDVDIA